MEISSSSSPWHLLFNSPFLFPHQLITPQNYVHWNETPESHIYSANLPGVRKEEIRVEVEDSIYLIIRTEAASRTFARKFRLPGSVDIDGIAAKYESGVLTVTVPRNFVRRDSTSNPLGFRASGKRTLQELHESSLDVHGGSWEENIVVL